MIAEAEMPDADVFNCKTGKTRASLVSRGVRRLFYYGFEINHSPYHPSFLSSPYHTIVEILRTAHMKTLVHNEA
jgi:hypothetical protein